MVRCRKSAFDLYHKRVTNTISFFRLTTKWFTSFLACGFLFLLRKCAALSHTMDVFFSFAISTPFIFCVSKHSTHIVEIILDSNKKTFHRIQFTEFWVCTRFGLQEISTNFIIASHIFNEIALKVLKLVTTWKNGILNAYVFTVCLHFKYHIII